MARKPKSSRVKSENALKKEPNNNDAMMDAKVKCEELKEEPKDDDFMKDVKVKVELDSTKKTKNNDTDDKASQKGIVKPDPAGAVVDETKDSATKGKGTKKGKKKKRSEDDDGVDDQQPKEKKIRVKPEKVEEVREKIIIELVKNYKFGIVEVPMDTLATSIGYKHPRSDAIAAAMKSLKEDGWVDKTKNICKFTEQGIKANVPEEKPAENPEEAMAMFWNQFQMKLDSNPKASGTTVAAAAEAIWSALKDGKAYSKKELVDLTSYGMVRSTGFEQIMKALKDIGFTEESSEKGKLQFSDKVFPFGRP